MLADSVVETNTSIKTNQQRVDDLLGFEPVRNEVAESFRRAITSRSIPEKPPRLRYLSSFNSVAFCPPRGEVYEAEWNEFHAWILQDHRVDNPETGETLPYISGYSFRLRAAPDIHVIRLDTVDRLEIEDLQRLESLGYTVMDPEHSWVISDSASSSGWSLKPSALSPRPLTPGQ